MGKLRFGASMLGVLLMKMSAVLAGQTLLGQLGMTQEQRLMR